jgi:DNA-binding PadR family transcriptional regulator
MDYTCRAYWNGVLNASLCKFLILKAVCDRPMHGYAIIRRVGELTGNLCVPTQGTVYPALREFEQCGCVRGRAQTVRGRLRRVYTATPKGRTALAAGMDVWRQCLARIQAAVKAPRARARRR